MLMWPPTTSAAPLPPSQMGLSAEPSGLIYSFRAGYLAGTVFVRKR
jgi:hypothetical protein